MAETKMIAVVWKRGWLADHRRQLEAVELGHDDVDEDDGDVLLEQVLERLPPGTRHDQRLAELAQDRLVAQQLRRLIVDQQDVDGFVGAHARESDQRCSHMRNADSSCSVLTGLAR